MSSSPGWFGEQRQFGWVQLPDDGRARAGVLLCPSLGSEAEWSHYCLRLLADELESRRLAVVRFDYPGLGHGAGDLKTAWTPGVLFEGARRALSWLRSTGVASVAVAGFRLGAAIAAHLAMTEHEAGTPLDGLVLWNPVLSGRQFLREHRAVRRFADGLAFQRSGGPSPGETDDFGIGGYVFPAQSETDLRGLDITGAKAAALPPALVIADTAEMDSLRQRLPWAEHAQWFASRGTDFLFDWTNPPPTAAIAAAGTWMARRLPTSDTGVSVPPHSDEIVMDDDPAGLVAESVQWLGPLPCFGTVTRPAGTDRADLPKVALVNTSREPSVGPARLWVELARHLAARGRSVLRVDLSGLGDSPGWPDQERFVLYQPQAIADVVDVVSAWAPEAPGEVILAGVCSGGYNVLEAAVRLGSRKVIAVNPVTDAPLPGEADGTAEDSDGWAGGGRLASVPRRRWLRAVQETAPARRLRQSMPPWGWRMLDTARIQASPARALLPLAAGGTETVLVCGPDDAGRFERRGAWLMRPLVEAGRLHFITSPRLDHSALLRDGQDLVRRIVLEHAGSLPTSAVRSPGATLG